ncbi:MAG: hypothetical protein JSW27_04220 [Phycisphaerales bacterium]|nr:MAG: hypothetical protein JSW27_04220 [Phycisphaerales bacterium]
MVQEKGLDRHGVERCWQGIILLGLFVYAWWGIEPHLLYYGFGVFTAYPVFCWEGSFLQAVLSTPGGPVNALAALLAQSYHDDALGALAIVAVLGTLALGIQHLLHSIQAGSVRDLAWVPALLAVMIYNHYENPLPVLLAIGLSIWTAILQSFLPIKTWPGRAGLFLILFVLTYYLAGASAFVFASLVCLTEALTRRRAFDAIVPLVLAGGAVFVLGRFAFDLELASLHTTGTPWDPVGDSRLSPFSNLLALILYAYAPGLVIAASLGRVVLKAGARLRPAGRKRNTQAGNRHKEAEARPARRSRLAFGLRPLTVILTAVLCLALSRSHIRYERALHYHAQQRDWDQVLTLARRIRGRHPFARSGVFDINRALAHRGLLGSELCAYPQNDTRTLFLSFDDMTGRLQHVKQLELFLDLGCANAAEKNVYELLDNEGPSPLVLEAMVRVHLAKEEHESARIALRALEKYAGGGRYVRRWQDAVANPNQAQVHTCLQNWRRARPITDHAVMGVSFEPTLKRLLQDHPDHRLALEYLMAYYLLKHQRARLVSCLPLLRAFDYQKLPRHYAEALLVHSLETRTPVDAFGWTIEPDLRTQFREIRAIVTGTHGDNQAAFDKLAPKYGDTYTFYSMFNVCGVK